MAQCQHTPTLASLEDAVTVLFCLVDDTYGSLNPCGTRYEALKKLLDSEVLALALFQQLRGIESERSFLRDAARFFSQDGGRGYLRGGTRRKADLGRDHPGDSGAASRSSLDAGQTLDNLSRSSVRKKKGGATGLEVAALNPEWAVDFCDECWWSRLALPTLSSWAEEGKPLRLAQQSVAKDDPEPKAISCYGLYVPEIGETWLRFVDGRPVSSITTQFLSWCCEKLEAIGKKAVVLIWDNASWHISREVRRWLGKHNREVSITEKSRRAEAG